MARKELGYVELEWSCAVCKTRNPGTQTTCSGCGAAQPADVQFEAPTAATLTQDTTQIKRAQTGPDLHCAFCGTRNSATAASCRQCGADLSAGRARSAGGVVGAFTTAAGPQRLCSACKTENSSTARTCIRCGAPLSAPPAPPAAQQPEAGRSWLLPLLIGAGLLLVGLGWLLFALFQTDQSVGTAVDARWERSLAILGPVPVSASGWRDQVPAGAANLSCSSQVRTTSEEPQPGAREVCGTPYTLDTGTGMGQVVQDCVYEVSDDFCSYTTLQLGVVDTLVQRGTGLTATWPNANLRPQQQLGQRNEHYECVVVANDQRYSFTLASESAFSQCQPGSRWQLTINQLDNVVEAKFLP